MALVNIDTVGAIGLSKDEKSYRLDPTIWTEAFNVRAVDGEIHSIGGKSQVFGQPSTPPQFLLFVSTPTIPFWLYAGLTAVYAYDGVTHTNITRVSGGGYTASGSENWQGIVFGGIPILNNGIDVPQYWANASTGTKLADLANWSSTKRAAVIRALGPHLIAFGITESGTLRPHKILWSHPASAGSVPTSWDPADTTKDAREYELSDATAGPIQDALALRGQMFIYKERATWIMRYVGGRVMFSFNTFLDTSGLLCRNAVAQTGDGRRHLAVTQDDIIIHDGVNVQSIVDRRMRRTLFSSLDPSNYKKTFVGLNYFNQEMWICYPTVGSSTANRALVWNYKTGAMTEADVNFTSMENGSLVEGGSETWDDLTMTWDEMTTPWSNVLRTKTLVAVPSDSKILLKDSGLLNNGASISSTLQRTGLALLGQKRDKSPIVDFNQRKLVTRVWPRMRGGPVDIRLGAQQTVEGSVSWGEKVSFNPETDEWVDLTVEGRAIAIEFSSPGPEWQLEGYKLDLVPNGDY